MTHFSTSAIVLSRRTYADFDLIVTVMTRDYGKRTLIAKSAKKSVKRFPGGLEPFTQLQIIFRQGRGKGMCLLEEADMEQPYPAIRSNIRKTAYANYWAELLSLWLEADQVHADIFQLLVYVLGELDRDNKPEALINIIFQLRFIGVEGFRPILGRCAACQTGIDTIDQNKFCIDLQRGGIVCHQCPTRGTSAVQLSKGTLKQLHWVMNQELTVAERVRFSPQGLKEATAFLEAFVPYHIGRSPKSLRFLRQICAGH